MADESDESIFDSETEEQAIAVIGEAGCGKTSAVYAVCKELNLNVIEINPTDKCCGKQLLEMVGEATQSLSLSRYACVCVCVCVCLYEVVTSALNVRV